MESADSPIAVPYSNDLETWLPFIDGELTTVDDIFEVGSLGGFAQIMMKPPSQEQLDSFHTPTNDELASYSLKKKQLVAALSRAAIRVEQLRDLCSQYEGLAQSLRSRLRPSTIRSKGFKKLVTKQFRIHPWSSATHGFSMSREELTSALKVIPEKGIDGLSSNPGHLFSASRTIEEVVVSLRELIAQYKRDRSQLEGSIHLYSCAGSITRLLPDELLLKIFSYLPGVEPKALPTIVDCLDFSTAPKVVVALTCRRWKHTVFNYPELWSSIRLDCRPFQNAKLKTLSASIPSIRRHLGRAQMCKRLDVQLVAWYHPGVMAVPDLMREQGKLLSPLLTSSSAQWSTLSIHAQDLSTLVNLGLFEPWTFPNLTHLTIMGINSGHLALDYLPHPFIWGSIEFPSLTSLTLHGFLAGELGFPVSSFQPDLKRSETLKGFKRWLCVDNRHVKGVHKCAQIEIPPRYIQEALDLVSVTLTHLEKLNIGCQFMREGLQNITCPSLTDLRIFPTELPCKSMSCSADEDHLILPKDHSSIVDFIARSNCAASTLQVLTLTHLVRPALVLDLLPLLDNLRTLAVFFFMQRWQSSLDVGAWCNPTSPLLKALTVRVGTDGQQPSTHQVPHLQQLSLGVEREPGAYSGGIDISLVEDFCRSRLKPPDGPVLHFVHLRDQVERHPDACLVALRSWAKVNAPGHDFRVWFDGR
ncbi:hypothetical protein BKA70DRAFT_1447660 [Coprinopsis sp. MPI-PUGE-AT-0042]|nr:hypothetical protein BKA70DRAFT_1447660 [Coprinopsis sp. MPI-PUGE-AT-0042]